MRKRKLFDAISSIDEKFIEEATPKYKRKSPAKMVFALVAAISATLILSIGLWLFVPYTYVPENLRPYADSEYYGVISALNAYKTKIPVFSNNFDRYTYLLAENYNSLQNAILGGDEVNGDAAAPGDGMNPDIDIMPDEAPGASKPDIDYSEGVEDEENVTNSPAGNIASPSYQETTDNQVDGVIETDLFKRSNEYIFYLHGSALKVYSIDKENSKLIAECSVNPFESSGGYLFSSEMFLSQDAKTLTVISTGYVNESKISIVTLSSYDVSSPESGIEKKAEFSVIGKYISARLVDGDILLMTRFMATDTENFDDPAGYIPQINCGNGFESVPADSIVCPKELTNTNYTVICRIGENDLELKDSISLLSYAQNVYVSKDNIYAYRETDKQEQRFGYSLYTRMTDIVRISYSDGKFTCADAVTVDGYVKDQYSLDEHEGILRVVTTTEKYVHRLNYNMNFEITDDLSTSANLYCIGIDDMKVKASVVGFAPKGETVRSARFDGDEAYVCTAIKLTDPVFFFDLSDIENITYKETEEIEGYSSSLIDLGEGYLLGIGYGSSMSSLKIEIYKQSEDAVVSVCKYELEGTYFSEEYKSYYINREDNLVGLGITQYRLYSATQYSENANRYILLCFDGYELSEILNVQLEAPNHIKRATLIDGYFYMLGGNDFKVVKIS